MSSGGFCAQLALVLRKNLIFKKRNRKDVLLEILFPCLFFLLLGVLKSNVGTANQLRSAAGSVWGARRESTHTRKSHHHHIFVHLLSYLSFFVFDISRPFPPVPLVFPWSQSI